MFLQFIDLPNSVRSDFFQQLNLALHLRLDELELLVQLLDALVMDLFEEVLCLQLPLERNFEMVAVLFELVFVIIFDQFVDLLGLHVFVAHLLPRFLNAH